MIAIVDYCKGNLKSVERGIEAVGGKAFITDDPACIKKATAIVLPGVGSFAEASLTMQDRGQMEAIRECIVDGKPFLGICLGMHLMFEEGVEGSESEGAGKVCAALQPSSICEEVEASQSEDGASQSEDGAEETEPEKSKASLSGLSILPGVVKRMPKINKEGMRFKVPHVGWNTLSFVEAEAGPLLQDIKPDEYFYFTHSYVAPDTPCTLAHTQHSMRFPSVVHYEDHAFGVQFHPEKSSDAGLALLRNFLKIVKGS